MRLPLHARAGRLLVALGLAGVTAAVAGCSAPAEVAVVDHRYADGTYVARAALLNAWRLVATCLPSSWMIGGCRSRPRLAKP